MPITKIKITTIALPADLVERATARAVLLHGRRGFSRYVRTLIAFDLDQLGGPVNPGKRLDRASGKL